MKKGVTGITALLLVLGIGGSLATLGALEYFNVLDLPLVELGAVGVGVPGKEVELVDYVLCAQQGCSGGCYETYEKICPLEYEYCELWFTKRCSDYYWESSSYYCGENTPKIHLNEIAYAELNQYSQLVETCNKAEKCEHTMKHKEFYECYDWVLWGVNPGDVACSSGERQCSGMTLQKCKADLSGWEDLEECENGCYESTTSTGKAWAECNECIPNSPPQCSGDILLKCIEGTTKWESLSEPCAFGCLGGECQNPPECPECPDSTNPCKTYYCSAETNYQCILKGLDGPQEGWSGYDNNHLCKVKVCEKGAQTYEEVVGQYIYCGGEESDCSDCGCVDGYCKECNCDTSIDWEECNLNTKRVTGVTEKCNYENFECEVVETTKPCECKNGDRRCDPDDVRQIQECQNFNWVDVETCDEEYICQE